MPALEILDYISVFIFALTGALTASRAQLDIIGFGVMASLTAIGGGTLRDILLNRDTIFWIADPTVFAVISVAAVLVFFSAHLVESRYRWLLWLDAAALSVAVTAGVGVALTESASIPVVLIMGIVTGTFGGLMRDVVANEVPLLLTRGELYASAAFGGAASALAANTFTDSPVILLASCMLTTLALRTGSIAWGWRLPVYKARPPKV